MTLVNKNREDILFNRIPVALFRFSAGGKFLQINQALVNLLGYRDIESFPLENAAELFEYKSDWQQFLKNLKNQDKHCLNEIQIKNADGLYCWVRFSAWRVDSEAKRTKVFEGCLEDISELKRSEEQYYRLFDRIPIGIFRSLQDGTFIDANPTLLKILEYPDIGLLLSKDLDEVYSNPSQLEKMLGLLKREGVLRNHDINLLRYDGSNAWVRMNARIVQDEEQQIYITGSMEDITERKIAEIAVRETSNKLQTLIQAIPDIVYFKSEDGRNMIVNKAFANFTNLKLHEIAGKHDREIFPEEMSKLREEKDLEVLENGGVHRAEELMLGNNGSTHYFDSVRVPFYDENGRITGLVGVSRDISDLKDVENELRSSEEKYRLLVENQTDLIIKMDTKGRFLFVSPSYCHLFGKTDEKLLGQSFLKPIHKEDLSETEKILKKLHSSPYRVYIEYRAKTPDGIKWLGWMYTAVLDLKGKVVEIIGVGRNISVRKKAEQALLESEQRYRELAETLPIAVFETNINAQFTYLNRVGLRKLGISRLPKRKKLSATRLIHTDFKKQFKSDMARRFRGEELGGCEYLIKSLKGRLFPILVHASVIYRDDQKVGFRGTVQDLSKIRQAEADLRQSEVKFRGIVEQSRDGIALIDSEGKIFEWNSGMEEITGLSRKNTRNDFFWNILYKLSPDSVKPSSKEFKKQKIQYKELLENRHIPQMNEVIETKIQTPDKSEKIVQSIYFPIEIKDDVLLAIITRDVTHLKLAEKEHSKLEERMLQTQKLESLGVLAGGIAHDFNNLLVGVLGNATLAKMELRKDSPIQENLQLIEKAAQRAAELTKQMLAYAGQGKFVVQTLSITDVVKETAALLKASISTHAILELRLKKDLQTMEGDATQIRQLVMNLITNASEALNDSGGKITVSTGIEELTEDQLKGTILNDDLPGGKYIFFRVDDTGCGMDKKTLKRIFDPFFTTKFTGRGLGLAAVLGIVRGHKGAIQVLSKPSKGTTFTIYFPLPKAETPNNNGLSNNNKFSILGNGEKLEGTVLVVDDEESVIRVAKRILEKAGLTVLKANSGEKAVKLYGEKKDTISTILLDLTMPKMSGETTFKELKKINKKVKVVLSSGFSEEVVRKRFKKIKPTRFIQKPYRPEELIESISELIGK